MEQPLSTEKINQIGNEDIDTPLSNNLDTLKSPDENKSPPSQQEIQEINKENYEKNKEKSDKLIKLTKDVQKLKDENKNQ